MAELYQAVNLEAPASGVYELMFTSDSNEPEDYFESGDFYTGGLAEKYTYVVYGRVVGTAEGAPDCCGPTPAYNSTVPLYQAERWAPTQMISVTDFAFSNFGLSVLFFFSMLSMVVIAIIYTVVLIVRG